MKLRIIPVVGLLLAGVSLTKAQQDPQFTQFYFNKVMINPAAAGAHGNICATLFNRLQWTGFEGAPFTTQLTADASLQSFIKHDIGVGLTVFNDRIGFFNNFGLRVQGAYRFALGPGKLGIGIDLGMLNQSVGGAWNPAQIEPNLPTGSSTAFDAGLGVYYQAPTWYAGISSLHLPASRLKDISMNMARHYYIMGGYTLRAVGGNPNWDLSPNVLIKTDFAAAIFDINCNVIYKQRYWGGLAYRFTDAIAINLGANIIQKPTWSLTAGYSYDLTTSRLLKFSSGSHELMLRYCFVINKDPKQGGGFRVRDLDSMRD